MPPHRIRYQSIRFFRTEGRPGWLRCRLVLKHGYADARQDFDGKWRFVLLQK
jgi:hypothetical protein